MSSTSSDQRIARATALIDRFPEAREILEFYREMAASTPVVSFAPGPVRSTCPACDAKPVVIVLRGEGEGAKRSLVCGKCSTEWPFRRVLCPGCGEEDHEKLPIYTAEGLDWVRIEACDTCRTYLKAVDLTKDGHAIPVVDEIATVTLGIWAEERGYTKLEPNLLGM